MGELATTFYREEGRRVKLRVEKKSYSSLELSVRYNFKASFAEPVCFLSMRFATSHKTSCYYFLRSSFQQFV